VRIYTQAQIAKAVKILSVLLHLDMRPNLVNQSEQPSLEQRFLKTKTKTRNLATLSFRLLLEV
jgi:hypothetical protein